MKVLFVCTGNTCRSPMAEGILKKLARDKELNLQVNSAGIAVYQGGPAAQNTIEVMNDINIDMSNHRSSQLSKASMEEANLILTMSRGHKYGILNEFPDHEDKVFNLIEYAYGKDGDIGDPYGGSKELYEEIRDEIYRAIELIVDSL